MISSNDLENEELVVELTGICIPALIVSLEGGLVYKTNALMVLDATVETPIPYDYYLSEAYPNPFNAVTRLTYGLPEV